VVVVAMGLYARPLHVRLPVGLDPLPALLSLHFFCHLKRDMIRDRSSWHGDERMAQEIVALCIHQFLCTAYGEASLIAAVVLCHLCATGDAMREVEKLKWQKA
jgi:hypothetical protein